MADYSNVSFKNDGKLKLLIIVGTRPEIIRLAAVINKTRKYFDVILAHTGQNYDYNLNGVFFHDLQLDDPEVYLNAVGADLGETMGNIIAESYKLMAEIRPDALLVLGDTNSYGTTQENLNSFVSTMKDTYPNLKIVGVEPSVFRPLSLEEENELLERINGSGADFVWVALGAPRQEMFCNKLSGKTQALWVAVGGALNVISGVIPRAPQWMQNHGLEWFYRFMKEPRRLFKRYFVTNSKFLWYLFRDKGEK